MALTPNMKLIEAKTVGAGGIASVTFNSIPQTYTDLKIYMSARVTAGGNTSDNAYVTFNGATDRYYEILCYGAGTSAGSVSAQNANAYLQWSGSASGNVATANVFSTAEVYITNYTSSNSKVVTSNWANIDNSVNGWSGISSGLWNPTSNTAITSMTIAARSAATSFVEGSTFYLYGISSTAVTGTKATGGAIMEDADYFYHVFGTSGVFTPTQSLSCDLLVIGGGGSGGGFIYGGGGGAGGLVYSPAYSLTTTSYVVTVGAGGAGNQGNGANGTDTTFSSIYTATGGGRGGSWNADRNGQNGGSGGGGGENSGVGTAGTATQTSYGGLGFGNNGAIWSGGSAGGGGGSGGAGGVSGTGFANSAGGVGKQYTTFANATGTGKDNGYYAAGGAGCSNGGNPFGVGGLGGGGNGSGPINSGIFATAGAISTGSGGGGDNTQSGNGGNGGSGLVIVRYAK